MDQRTKTTIEQYDKIASDYAQTQKDYNDAGVEVDKFIKLLPVGSMVLDLGCAGGRDTKILTLAGMRAIGIDLSKKLLEIARTENPTIEFRVADIRQIPFPDNSVDGIVARGVIHHLDINDIKSALKEFCRVLKQGGILFIMTKSGKGVIKNIDILSSGKEREFTLLSQDELSSFLANTGFKKIEIYTWNERQRGMKGGRDVNWISAFYSKV